MQLEMNMNYNLCVNQGLEYQKKVDGVSKLLGLTGKGVLKGDRIPIYMIGRPTAPFVLFSLNPGSSTVEEDEHVSVREHRQR
jgi:hypothetical protein